MKIALYSLGFLLLTVLIGFVYERIASQLDARRHPAPGHMIDLGTHKLHVRLAGTSGPTVVLEAGAGSSGLVWERVVSAVARFARVVTVDRAGYGWSEQGPSPRTAARSAAELKSVLLKMGLPGPYILVGHSFGGLVVRTFTAQHPELVSGMVLVDATHEDELTDRFPSEHVRGQTLLPKMMRLLAALSRFGVVRLLARTGALSDLNAAAKQLSAETAQQLLSHSIKTSALRAAASEVGTIAHTYELTRQSNDLGNLPLVVLVHGLPGPVLPRTSPDIAAEIEAMLLMVAEETAAHSTQGRLVVAKNSRHDIHITEPDLVVEAIQIVTEGGLTPAAGSAAPAHPGPY